MPARREDYLLRLVSDAAAALRRLRERLRDDEPAGDVAAEARGAVGALLGDRAALLAAVDAASAAALLGDPRTVTLWAALLRVEAESLRRLGDHARADWLEARADALENTGRGE